MLTHNAESWTIFSGLTGKEKTMFQESELSTNQTPAPTQPTPPKAAWQRDAEARLRQYKASDAEQEEEARTADSNFIKVYPQGWEKLRRLIDDYPQAAKMYAFLAQHIDAGAGAVIVSQELMAESFNVSVRTIRRMSKYLEENNALIRIKIQGNLYAYALNPDEVWKSWKDNKDYAAFTTRTLARNKDNPDVKRRLNVMLKNITPPLPGFEEHLKSQ